MSYRVGIGAGLQRLGLEPCEPAIICDGCGLVRNILSGRRMVHRSGGVLLVLPGAYESSSGTRAEVAEAERLGMYVFQAAPANLLDSLVLTTVGAGTDTSLATVKGATLRLWLERYAEGRR